MAARPVYRISTIRRKRNSNKVEGAIERIDGEGAATFMIPVANDPGFRRDDRVVVRKWSIGSPHGSRKRYAALLSRAGG